MKKTFLCILIILTLSVITTLSIYKYNKLDNKEISKANDVTDSSALALVLVEGYDADEKETVLTEFPDPNSHYLDLAKSYCTNGASIGWDNINNKVRITSDKADSCKLYFREGTAANPKADILARNTLVTTTPNFANAATDENQNIYQAQDDLGTSYYFRGAALNNYVEFGYYEKGSKLSYFSLDDWQDVEASFEQKTPMYWRIVRINGDGTIRLVYDGTERVANGTNHIANIGWSNYNSVNNVGFTYDTSDTDSTQISSEIKKQLDSWYETHLKKLYGKYIADSIFCNDRSGGRYYYIDEEGYPTTEEYAVYSAYLYSSFDRTNAPILTCQNKSDKYSISKSIGNGYLSNPVGLITGDEATMAGYYMQNGDYFWTITPISYRFDDQSSLALMWSKGFEQDMWELFPPSGYMVGVSQDEQPDVARPVINLRADLLFTGNGTLESPYKVAGFE